MVLEEATTSADPPPDTFTDNASPSDADPYSDANGGPQQKNVRIDLSEFPLPPPFIGALVGYPRSRVAAIITDYLKAASHVLRRPLTQDEAKALTYHTTKATSTTAYAASGGALLGMARCYQTRREYRFPFWNPSTAEAWNPDVLGPLKGQRARMVYQAIRVPPYWFLGAFVAGFFVQGYSMATSTIAIAKDERLTELNEAVKSMVRNRSGLPGRTQPAGAPPVQPAPAPGQTGGGSEGAYDDMSPASGGGGGAYADSPVMSDSQTPSSDSELHAAPRWGGQDRQVGQQAARASSYGDDASPTGGLGPMDSSSTTGGSAWDRVRQQASSSLSEQGPSSGSASSAPWARSAAQREQRAGSDSFSFSSVDEDRQLAKSEAQRAFDERVEKERRGVDFDEGGKGW